MPGWTSDKEPWTVYCLAAVRQNESGRILGKKPAEKTARMCMYVA